ncbi:hypothetical protein FDC50_15260 [Clostridium botulinum]|nr:hypothetical protein KU41_01110 [Clostridium botulinum]MBY6803373.1 hypothetical protein [Clostridium botulinum]MBY6813918.1 hypothetical protein [Clostridium botulinum]MBY6820141.1 hypothetical protein [Clostridium botulinum]NFJ52554.1 hypothetical protein [Clostridium botulinum]
MRHYYCLDATCTWSGYIYQGDIAIYLALNKIVEKIKCNKDNFREEIDKYYLELEWSEDVAIKHINEGGSEVYDSIHQVKCEKNKLISHYEVPLLQLLYERAIYDKEFGYKPEVYLHLKEKIPKAKTNDELKKYICDKVTYIKNEINELKKFEVCISSKTINKTEKDQLKKILDEDHIKINRSEFIKAMNAIKECCDPSKYDNDKLYGNYKILMEIVQKNALEILDDNVELYQYSNGDLYVDNDNIDSLIEEKLNEYFEEIDDPREDEEKKFIAMKLQEMMRKHIKERHKKYIKNREDTPESIGFSIILDIINKSYDNFEKASNLLALRRRYDILISKYCEEICDENLCDECCYECKLNEEKIGLNILSDKQFKKLCYTLNPNCRYPISKRDCLFYLLNVQGMNGCFFKGIKEINEGYVSDDNFNGINIKIENLNLLLTAISRNGYDNKTIIKDIEKNFLGDNPELIEQVFESDQIITYDMECEADEWNIEFSDIDFNDENLIVNPKKPKFIAIDSLLKGSDN